MDVPLAKFLVWPPFYTLQPNLDTQNQQLSLWSQVILDYAKNNKIYVATIESFDRVTRNSELNRFLSEEFKDMLFKHMKKQKFIIAEGLSMLIFWQKPETWAEMIYRWASNSGRIGTVETVEGLVSGDETTSEEFYGMPVNYAIEVLKTLQKSKKAEMFAVGDSYAVKFF
ncbi:hypothetical protein SteCoe_36635 [Stentor coeruleus]|uniref:Vacuolar protein-sorting-associated protein 25 n=1 Tax=Stentor coeruleus TaxID=5963 RepID=A0A1R2APN4_9CILI|nr:hypothetical protein SteCoe_36635 [Stentor coeruleus]